MFAFGETECESTQATLVTARTRAPDVLTGEHASLGSAASATDTLGKRFLLLADDVVFTAVSLRRITGFISCVDEYN